MRQRGRRHDRRQPPARRAGSVRERLLHGYIAGLAVTGLTSNLRAAEAYLRGPERRLEAGVSLDVASVASVFISRWDAAVAKQVGDDLRGKLGVAIAKRTYAAYRSLLAGERWQRLAAAGARPQRLLWASTGTKDPAEGAESFVKSWEELIGVIGSKASQLAKTG